MAYFGYIVLSIVILLAMVLIHELGHYVAAKLLGFTVEEFSVGFGPKLLSKRRKNGELFSLRMFPLGGFCAFLGETDDETSDSAPKPKRRKRRGSTEDKSDCAQPTANADAENNAQADNGAVMDNCAADNAPTVTAQSEKPENDDLLSYVMRAKIDEERAEQKQAEPAVVRLDKHGNPAKTFYQQKPWKRIIVLLDGVTFNFLSAIIFAFVYIWAVGYTVPVVESRETTPDGGYYCEYLQDDDVILAINGKKISVLRSYSELIDEIKEGETATFTVSRGGETLSVEVLKRLIPTENEETGEIEQIARFGFRSRATYTGNNAANAFTYCVPFAGKIAWLILGLFWQLITGKAALTSISGPVGSINQMAQVSMLNWRNTLFLLPMLASNLAVFNILPFPALDGAQIIFTIVEWIRRKPLNRKVMGMINFIGMVVLLLFVVIVDILSFAL